MPSASHITAWTSTQQQCRLTCGRTDTSSCRSCEWAGSPWEHLTPAQKTPWILRRYHCTDWWSCRSETKYTFGYVGARYSCSLKYLKLSHADKAISAVCGDLCLDLNYKTKTIMLLLYIRRLPHTVTESGSTLNWEGHWVWQCPNPEECPGAPSRQSCWSLVTSGRESTIYIYIYMGEKSVWAAGRPWSRFWEAYISGIG